MDRLLWEHKFPFFWDECQKVKLLNYMVVMRVVLKETAKLFYRVCTILHTHE
jgi:hypothetical protein